MTILDFEQAYDDHAWQVFGFFAYRVGARADAEDLTQLTFERALKAWERYDRRRASLETWLLTIARNLLIDHYRAGSGARGNTTPLDELQPDAMPSVAGPEEDLGLSPELADALSELDERGRELIALRYGADLTGPEIAELTGLSLSNVQQILSRSMRKMRVRLAPSSEELPVVPAAEGH